MSQKHLQFTFSYLLNNLPILMFVTQGHIFIFSGIIILTVLEEFNLNEFVAVMAFLEVLVIPAWIWIYKEIKRQSQYEIIPPDPEEQPNNEV